MNRIHEKRDTNSPKIYDKILVKRKIEIKTTEISFIIYQKGSNPET